ncbi:MAG TPA: WD40 repeat domain-containing protein [Gemmataceae bacterium]|nr:WD40 repeat domain-containing protein [Gemmataceae bacterium]
MSAPARWWPVIALLPALVVSAVLAQPAAPNKAAPAWTLPWDADWVTAVCFLGPKRLAAGNNLGQILVWDLPDEPSGPPPAPSRRLDGHTNTINRLVATPDGRWLISASSDRTIRYWDMQAAPQGEEKLVLNARAIADANSPAGKRANKKVPPPLEVTVSLSRAVRMLDGHRDWVLGLSLSQDGSILVSGDDKGEVIVWDRPAGQELRRWKVKGWCWALALAPQADRLLVAERFPLVFDSGRHAGLKLWDPRDGKLLHDLGKDKDFSGHLFAAAAFSPDGKLLAVARGGEVDGPNGKVLLIDPVSGKKVRELAPGHLNGATDVVFTRDGQHIVSSGRDTTVRIWRVDDGTLVKELGQPRGGQFKDWFHSVAVSPDRRWIAAADMAGQVQVWTWDNTK